MTYTIRPPERAMFKRCRRQWDFGARPRRNLEPVERDRGFDLGAAVREALAVYYFPGMWDWDRPVVLALVRKAFERAAGRADSEQRAAGLRLLDAYCAWAQRTDRFQPIRVETDFSVDVPEPARARFSGRIQMLALDGEDRLWVCDHRLVTAWSDLATLVLDEQAAASCWAWQEFWLMDVAGSVTTELRMDERGGAPEFRRTWVQRSRDELVSTWRRLAQEALDMTEPGLRVYPTPLPENCLSCAYRRPCLALEAGEDPTPILDAEYRTRPEEQPEEGRLGGSTWGLGRGAMPATSKARERQRLDRPP